MRTFKKVISVVALLLMVAVIAVFVLENRQPVGLTFFGWTAPQLSLAVPVILALLLGMLIGPVLTWFAGFRKKRTVSTRSA